MKAVPIRDQVVIDRSGYENHESVIGRVVAIGPNVPDDVKRPEDDKDHAVDVGDLVLASKYSGQEISVDGKRLLVVSFESILVRLETDA